MRSARLRFTVRSMMVAVAVVGVALGGVRMHRLSRHYAKEARHNATLENILLRQKAIATTSARRNEELLSDRMGESLSDRKDDTGTLRLFRAYMRIEMKEFDAMSMEYAAKKRKSAVKYARKAAHFAALRRKYERAARYPWLPVAADPPAPE